MLVYKPATGLLVSGSNILSISYLNALASTGSPLVNSMPLRSVNTYFLPSFWGLGTEVATHGTNPLALSL